MYRHVAIGTMVGCIAVPAGGSAFKTLFQVQPQSQGAVDVSVQPLRPDPARLKELGLELTDVEAPVPVNQPPIDYPERALQTRIQGTVGLRCVIEATGIVDHCQVTQSLAPECDEAAIAGVSRWSYTPTKVKGVAVSAYAEISVKFRLEPPSAVSPDSPKTQIGQQSPSEVARVLASRGTVTPIPLKKKVKHTFEKDAVTFDLPDGRTTAVMFQLPVNAPSYYLQVTSFVRGFGRTREIFVPRAVVLDADFAITRETAEDRWQGGNERLVGALAFDKKDRYLLLFTRGDLVGQPVDIRANVYGLKVGGKFGRALVGYRLERSLQGRIELQVKLH